MAYIDLSFEVSTNERNLIRNLETMPDQVREILSAKMRPLAQEMAAAVEDNIIERLNRKTGKLENAVLYEVTDGSSGVLARVWVDQARAPYAKAQEQGATIPPHMIYPKASKVLSFTSSKTGERIVTKRVAHPGAVLAPTWFMRDAYRQFGPRFTTAIKKAVVEGIRARMRSGS